MAGGRLVELLALNSERFPDFWTGVEGQQNCRETGNTDADCNTFWNPVHLLNCTDLSEVMSQDAAQFVFMTCRGGAESALKQEVARVEPEWRPSFSRPGFLTFKHTGEQAAR